MSRQAHVFYLASEHVTHQFAERLAQHCLAGLRIYFDGEIGAGKTTMIRRLVQSLGVRGAIKSPTFTIVEPYASANYNIYHFDLYRICDPSELEYIGWREYFDDGLCLVEWPSHAEGILPMPDLRLKLAIKGAGRECSCQAFSREGAYILNALEEGMNS